MIKTGDLVQITNPDHYLYPRVLIVYSVITDFIFVIVGADVHLVNEEDAELITPSARIIKIV